MESYGELLRKAREEKNLDLNKIAREISIEKRYLEGLETENTSVFPGEAYLIGFLRNYSAYLELDSDFVLKLYRNKQIQEAAVPEGLYAKPKVSRILLPSIIIPAALIVGVVIILLMILFIPPIVSADELESNMTVQPIYTNKLGVNFLQEDYNSKFN